MELTKIVLPALVCLLTITSVTAVSADPCAGCRYENGVGYLLDPTDCRNFLQCVNYGVKHFTRTCANGTYWSQKALSCSAERPLTCSSTIPHSTATATGVYVAKCDGTKRPDSSDRSKYIWKIAGHGDMTLDCPPGTVYEMTNCTCVHGGSVAYRSCGAELYLPFSDGTRDESDNHVHVQNKGVKILSDGTALFESTSGLVVPRFSNANFGTNVKFSFKMHPMGSDTAKGRAIITNTHCSEPGSIFIINRGKSIEFQVLNTSRTAHDLSVTYKRQAGVYNTVSLKISDGTVEAVVDGKKAQTPFNGSIQSVQCALHIGQGTGYDNFLGFLDDITVSFCKA